MCCNYNIKINISLSLYLRRKLTLSHNRIQSIEEKSFDSNLALQHIDLSNNKLSHLPKHLFRHLW